MISVENLTKSYSRQQQSVRALDRVSLDVSAGAACGVIGASGAGKSALARCMALLERPDSGAVRVDGTDVTALSGQALRAVRRRIGVVAPDNALQEQRTAAGNIAAPLEAANLSGPQRRSRVGELLDLAGLTDKADHHPEQLTAGQNRRVEIARALATQPAVLLADDPTAGLDPSTTDSVLTVLDRARAEQDVTTVIGTNDMSVVRRAVDEVAVLERGALVERGKLLDLVAEPGSRIGASLLPEVDGPAPAAGRYDVTAEVVLVGFAAVGALLPEASNRFGVELSVLGGGFTRLGETPVAKFRIGLAGQRSESALKWMIDRDAQVRRAPAAVESRAA